MSGCIVALLTVGALLPRWLRAAWLQRDLQAAQLRAIAVFCGYPFMAAASAFDDACSYPSPQRALNNLPLILQGEYSIEHLARLLRWTARPAWAWERSHGIPLARRDV